MRDNPYVGINPHLNSLLQTPDIIGQPNLWGSFHAPHVVHLSDRLNDQLPPFYISMIEQPYEAGATLRRSWATTIRGINPKASNPLTN